MKKITYLSSSTNEKQDAFLISNIKDLDEYNDYCKKAVDAFTNQFLTRDLYKEKEDVVPDCGQLRGIWKYTLFKSHSEGGHPLLMLAWNYQEKYERLFYLVANKKHVLINMNGGYEYKDSIPEILREEVVENLFLSENVKLNEGSSYIVLENDIEIDPKGHKIVSLVDKDYSYITSLSNHSVEDLKGVFDSFKDIGGENIYVYTTGRNIKGMYKYTEAAIKSGFKEIKIDFNDGLNDSIEEYLNHFKDDINIIYSNLKGKVDNSKRVRP